MDLLNKDSEEAEPSEPMERLRRRQRESTQIHIRMAEDPVIND